MTRFPTRPMPSHETLGRSLATWAEQAGHDLPARQTRDDAYRDLLHLVRRHLDPGPELQRVEVQLLAEYVKAMTGYDEPLGKTPMRHLGRLVAGVGGINALRYVTEAIMWGAGLEDGEDVRPDGRTRRLREGPDGILRYAIGVWNGEKRRAMTGGPR